MHTAITMTHTTVWPTWTAQWSDACTSTIWTEWTEECTNHPTAVTVASRPQAGYPQPSAELQAQWQASAERRKAASAAAEELLLSHLSEEQRAQYQREKFFIVRGSKGGLYRLAPGNSLRRLEGEQAVESLCVHPGSEFPEGDHLVTKKLWLEADETELRRIANITPLRASA